MITSLRRHRAGRAIAAVVLGAALSAMTFAAAAPASADALDDGQWWRKAMGVDELHRSGTGKGITVALIDGPIDSSVPELRGRVKSSRTECLARDGKLHSATMKSVDADHATSMASLIVGSGKGTASGGRGIAGIAPDATLLHYAAVYNDSLPGTRKKLDCSLRSAGVGEASRAVTRALRQAVKDGAKVISISLTVSYNDEFIPALLEAYRAGVIVVASTNNETREVYWPGSGNGVVTVTHVDAAGNLDDSAMRQSQQVDFTAPGVKIATGSWTPSGWRSDGISDGSSQATAITAGGLAAVWSAHPTATANQVLQAEKDAIGMRAVDGKYRTWFRRIGDNLPKATGKTESYGFGIASPADAVKLDVESLPDTNPMINVKGINDPTAEQIAAATGGASASATPASPSSSPSTSATTSNASGASSREPESMSTPTPWIVAGVMALGLLAGLVLFLRRSRQPSGVLSESQSPDTSQAHDTQNTQNTHNTSAAADGVAATTKEHSHREN